jgi:transposase
VWRSDLFDVTALPPVRAVSGRLPVYVAPQEGEALASWLARLGAVLSLSPLALCRMAFGIDPAADPEWSLRPSGEMLTAIAGRTGVGIPKLAAMTFTGWSKARDDEVPERLSGRYRPISPRRRNRGGGRLKVCPLCLAADRCGYLRLLWMNGWAGVCPQHRVALMGRCPSCGCVLRFGALNAREPINPSLCRKCGGKLSGADGDPAHPSTVQLQQLLFLGKRSGQTMLASAGIVDWTTTMALVDVLLGMVWIDIQQKYRERLFARIAKDLDLGDWGDIVWHSNYGGLLILAWLLGDLPAHLSAAIAILHAPRLDRLLARFTDLSDETSGRLGAILAPATASPLKGRRAWRRWIDNLPESGAELRERALQERYKLRRRRLFAFADVRDGARVAEASKSVGVIARTLYRWLHEGAEHGLEAALERPRRRSQLSGAQAEALGRWIAADRARQRRKAVIAEARARFAVVLSPEQASALLRVHRRTRPGRRRRPWRPRPGRSVKDAGPVHRPLPGR